MKKFFLITCMVSLATFCIAQNAIKRVYVELYYISDSIDATDITGGGLEVGSKTYRIFVQLEKGYKLTSVYGDTNHVLKISSTEKFFNNIDYGQTFGKDFSKSSLSRNTVALDSWLTLGQVTKKLSTTYFGVPKFLDTDGSFIGGANNDGGSEKIPGGLLRNNILQPLNITNCDGIQPSTNIPTNWYSEGFINSLSGVDSTIFGNAIPKNEFISYKAKLQNSGVSGVNADSNYILIAQLTTKGTISFELNIEVLTPQNIIQKYVAKKGIDSLSTYVSQWLKYPIECGCTNPKYLEYNKFAICSDKSQCKTPIILGCMDMMACNYNPAANVNVQELCCYPGFCANRDIKSVCPNLNYWNLKVDVYPNPVQLQLTITITANQNTETAFYIYNYYGNVIYDQKINTSKNQVITENIDVSNLNSGLYLIKFFSDNEYINKTFLKY